MKRRKIKHFNVIAALAVLIFFMCVFNIYHVQATNGNDDLVYTYESSEKSPLIDPSSEDVSKIVRVTIMVTILTRYKNPVKNIQASILSQRTISCRQLKNSIALTSH